MKISINRELLIGPLQTVASVVEKRQALPILSNVLITAEGNALTLTATDMEVEIIVRVNTSVDAAGTITLPARKLVDICRALPPEATINIEAKENRAIVRSGRSRFALSTLPAADFPSVGDAQVSFKVAVQAKALRDLISDTQFAMAHQDVRYYLNGLLLEFTPERVRAVATDGHRMALGELVWQTGVKEGVQIILPRKGVAEIIRLLAELDGEVDLQVGPSHLKAQTDSRVLTTKLIDGRFPEYGRVIPTKSDKVVVGDRETLRQGLARTSILSNEKFRGVRLALKHGQIHALAHNPDHEEAEEEIAVEYAGADLEIGFNVVYLLDVLSVIKTEKVQIELSTPDKSCLIQPVGDATRQYVVMPMRL